MSDTQAACFQGVTTSFDGQTNAVRGLDLVVAQGECVGLVGPPGAGKSVILGLLAGFTTPRRGQILLNGRPVGRTPPERRGLALVPRSGALLPHLTVAENVGLPLIVRGVARAARRDTVARTLDLVRLAGSEARRPADLSDPERQSVALARALVTNPPLILLDEPFGDLDRTAREAMIFLLRRIQRAEKCAMLYATRDAAEAMVLADRIALLDRGDVRQIGTPAALYEDPANLFAATYVGQNNALPGRIMALDEDIAEIRLRAGPVISARLGDAAGAGDHCTVCIRPERIALAAVEAIQMGSHALAAVVEEIIYRGDHVRVRLIIGADAELIVTRPAAAGLAGIAVGRPAALAWQPAHARAFRVTA